MALQIESAPFYYGQMTAKERSYVDYAQNIAMVRDIDNSIERNTDRSIAANALFTEEISSRIVDAQIATTTALYNNTRDMIGAFHSGLSDVSRQIGVMGANMSMAFAALNTTVQQSAQAIYDRLDTMNDILNNPSLTKSRELFRRAAVSYNKGYYEEARNDLLEALASNKTDYISWFLLGKTYLFGAGEFSNVIDLDAAVEALKNAVKYITADARKQEDARVMAAEMCFFLGLAQQTRAMDALHTHNEAESRNYLEQAGGSYSQSWDYSAQMLEARYNRARCKALLGDVQGAIADLETVVLADRNYCVKVCADNDFSSIGEEFATLIKKLKKTVFIPAKNDYDRIKTLLSEIASLGGTTTVTIPATFSEELPYFDVLDYAEKFKRFVPIVEKDLADRKAAIAKAEQAEKVAKVRDRIAKYKICIACGTLHTVGLKADGTVVAVGDNKHGQRDVSDWHDMVAVAACWGYTVGLKADGTVVAVGDNERYDFDSQKMIHCSQCEVSGWRDIVAISAGYNHTVGLKADGTVVAVGDNERYDFGSKKMIHCSQCEVSGWRDIVAVAAGSYYTIGLKADGTVVAVGSNERYDFDSKKMIHCGQCEVSGWRDIVAVAAGGYRTVGLKADGTVVAVGSNEDGQCNVSGWRDIVAVAAVGYHTVGLKADGTVVAVGSNKHGQRDVSDWHDIVAVAAGSGYTVGLKADGTVVAVGDNERYDFGSKKMIHCGQCEVSGWRDIGPFSEKLAKEKTEREAREAEAARQAKDEQEARAKAEREVAEAARKAKAEQEAKWQAQGLCIFCGGKLGGLFTKKCKSCGKKN